VAEKGQEVGVEPRGIEGDGDFPAQVPHHPALDRNPDLGVETKRPFEATPHGRHRFAGGERVAEPQGAYVAERRAKVARGGERESGCGAALPLARHEHRALFRDRRFGRPATALGHDGKPRAINPVDPAHHRNAPARAQDKLPGDGLADQPDPPRRRRLDPEAANAEIAHGTPELIAFEKAGGRTAILGPRARPAVGIAPLPAPRAHWLIY
jgi:hypothetical protein